MTKILSVIIFIALFKLSIGQVIYKDVNTTLTAGQFIALDIDTDGDNEIELINNTSQVNFYTPTILPGVSNVQLYTHFFATSTIDQLSSGENIGNANASQFVNGVSNGCIGCCLSENPAVWPVSVNDAYVAFRFTDNGSGFLHYGWIWIDLSLSGSTVTSITIKGIAYEATASADIITGSIPVASISVQGQGGATNVISGSTLQMEETVLPSVASNMNVIWSVTNGTGSATIDAFGVLTGGGIGTVTVEATASDGSGISGTTVITVDPLLVSGISVQGQGGATNVVSGSTLQMVESVLPANATDPSVNWSVTNGTGTATIDAFGVLTGGAIGTVTVEATANDGSGVFGTTVITVNPLLVSSISVQGQGGATNVVSGSTLQMVESVLPVNATDPSVNWSVTNGTGTATIDAFGVLTGGAIGTVTVEATANDGSGVSGTTVITVDPLLVSSISVQGQGGVTNVVSGSTLQMVESVLPANATDPSVSWSVTNGTGTATIDAFGVLTGGAIGTVTVEATANDGSGIVGFAIIDVENVSSLEEIGVQPEFRLFPNPFSEHIEIEVIGINQSIELFLFDLRGKLIQKSSHNMIEQGGVIKIQELESLQSGIYTLKIATESKTFIHKLFKN